MRFTFSITSRPTYIPFLRRFISAVDRLSGRRLGKRGVFIVSLALVEAVNNAIVHAYKGRSDGWIDISIKVGFKHLLIGVAETGAGFCLKGRIRRFGKGKGGRGLPIIRALMRDVEYRTGKKNQLIMRYCYDDKK